MNTIFGQKKKKKKRITYLLEIFVSKERKLKGKKVVK